MSELGELFCEQVQTRATLHICLTWQSELSTCCSCASHLCLPVAEQPLCCEAEPINRDVHKETGHKVHSGLGRTTREQCYTQRKREDTYVGCVWALRGVSPVNGGTRGYYIKVQLLLDWLVSIVWPSRDVSESLVGILASFHVEGEALPHGTECISVPLFLHTRSCTVDYFFRLGDVVLTQWPTPKNRKPQFLWKSTRWKQIAPRENNIWPIRPQCLYDLALPLPAFMCLGVLCATQWPLIKDWARALRRLWRHSYQMSTSQNSARPPEFRGCIVWHSAARHRASCIFRHKSICCLFSDAGVTSEDLMQAPCWFPPPLCGKSWPVFKKITSAEK